MENNFKRNLLVDGDYFGNRSIFTLTKNNPDITLESDRDQELFYNQMMYDFKNLYNVFKSYIDDIVFVFDSYSWRKLVDPIIPYYMLDSVSEDNKSSLIYKANRSKTKEESPINWHNFKVVLTRFYMDIKDYVKAFKLDYLEGDDLLYMVSHKYSEANQFNIIFCTDGDLKQLLNDNTILFRNITHSKQHPNGEFCVNTNLESIINRQTTLDERLLGKIDNKQEYLKSLLNLNGTERHLNVIESPLKVVLTKIISGDAKDNIFPLFRWLSSTGTRNYSITEKHIEKVLDKLPIYNDSDILNILDSSELPKRLIAECANECKQYEILKGNQKYIDSMYSQYKYNRKLNWLDIEVYKENNPELIRSFDSVYNQIESTTYFIDNTLESRMKDVDTDLIQTSKTNVNMVKENLLNSITLD